MRAFSAELMKLAAEIQDADIRKLLSERRGVEYLDGGRLLTNTEDEAHYVPNTTKMAAYGSSMRFASGSTDVLKSHKKKSNNYQKTRDYAGASIKGGLTGLGILGATNALRGRFGAPVGQAAINSAMKAARTAATAGAGIAVADRAYRYDDYPGAEKKAFVVSPNPGAAFRSPAASLAESGSTGGFKGRTIHDTGMAPKSVTIGQKFKLP